MKKSKQQTQFFWDKKGKKSRSRFNLLLLDYGEYFLEDLSAYFFPIPTSDLSKSFEISDTLKIQGRLKLCTRSIMFEPIELRFPIVKFPFKTMETTVEQFNLKKSELDQLSVMVSGFFTFKCKNYFEMKENNKVGPYKQIDHTTTGYRAVFALVHSDLQSFMVKVEQLRDIYLKSLKQGSGIGRQLLRPFLETATITNFDTSFLVNFHERLLLESPLSVKKIKPLIINPGSFMMTETRIYFQPSQLNNIGDSVEHFELKKVTRFYPRRYLLRQTGLEFQLNDGNSFLFVFDSRIDRDRVVNILRQISTINNDDAMKLLQQTTLKWQRREISNFEYIMYLNNEADRSGNDLTQYPVFPHIIADYKSKKLNLEDPNTFRDLSKPIGALNPERLRYFKERFHSMQQSYLKEKASTDSIDNNAGKMPSLPPPFLYGTHYSTPGYVLYYLVRMAPEHMLCLQNGKFDAPDRMFHSVADTWVSCQSNPADLKELIPEFFTGSGEFLINYDDLDLGHRHTGERLNDVELPVWADSPRDFIRKNAKALESDYVSNNLHKWIDLVFGYQQQGQAAIDADNLYYYLTYEGSVDLEQVHDVSERSALEMQIQEFGQTPKQLFFQPHPSRNGQKIVPSASLPNTIKNEKSSISTDLKKEEKMKNNETIKSEIPRANSKKILNNGAVKDYPENEKDTLMDVKVQHADEEFRKQVAQELLNSTSSTNPSDESLAHAMQASTLIVHPPAPETLNQASTSRHTSLPVTSPTTFLNNFKTINTTSRAQSISPPPQSRLSPRSFFTSSASSSSQQTNELPANVSSGLSGWTGRTANFLDRAFGSTLTLSTPVGSNERTVGTSLPKPPVVGGTTRDLNAFDAWQQQQKEKDEKQSPRW